MQKLLCTFYFKNVNCKPDNDSYCKIRSHELGKLYNDDNKPKRSVGDHCKHHAIIVCLPRNSQVNL